MVLVESGIEARRKMMEERARQPGHITPSADLSQKKILNCFEIISTDNCTVLLFAVR